MAPRVWHYYWVGKSLAFVACGNRSETLLVTTKRSEVTCYRCRKSWRFRNNGVAPR